MADGEDGLLLAGKSPVGAPKKFQRATERLRLALPSDPHDDLHGLRVRLHFALSEHLSGSHGHGTFVAQDRMAKFMGHQDLEEERWEEAVISACLSG